MHKKNGNTLTEVLVIIAILGILGALMYPALGVLMDSVKQENNLLKAPVYSMEKVDLGEYRAIILKDKFGQVVNSLIEKVDAEKTD